MLMAAEQKDSVPLAPEWYRAGQSGNNNQLHKVEAAKGETLRQHACKFEACFLVVLCFECDITSICFGTFS